MQNPNAWLAVLLVAACGSAASPGTARSRSGPYHPAIDPANFQSTIDNPYLPLVPGTIFKLVEKEGGETRDNLITVTNDTKQIMGVTCVVVRDEVRVKGVIKEDTFDWYAQDKLGNVWYFGEDTKEFGPRGSVSTEGSWEAGVHGAQPGIIMPAQPTPGTPAYRQEYGRGVAEDMGQVVAIHDRVTVPYGTFTDCVRTREWSLLESGTEKKWYARGVGVVRTESTSKEVAVLVSVTRP
jgi:hypothetical protein